MDADNTNDSASQAFLNPVESDCPNDNIQSVLPDELQSILFECAWQPGQKLILLVYAGSKAYGRDDAQSDIDLRGIFLGSAKDLLLQRKTRTMQADSADIVLQPLHQFFTLAAKGNPNVLEWLFTKEEHILYAGKYGRLLLENRSLFLSQQMIRSYLGFAVGSWKSLKKMLAQSLPCNDTLMRKLEKHASHIERLLCQLLQALETGGFSTWNPKRHPAIEMIEDPISQRQVYRIRADFIELLRSLHQQIEKVQKTTMLPETADQQALDTLEIQIALDWIKDSHKEGWV